MKMLKRILAGLLAVVLLLTVMPVIAADAPVIGKDLFIFDAEGGTSFNTGYTMGDYLTTDIADGSYKVTRAVALKSGVGFDYTFTVPEEGSYTILVKILQQGKYNYYINMLLDDKGVSGNTSYPSRYGISSRYAQDFHWYKLDTETLTAGTHKVTVSRNKDMILDRVMIVKSDYNIAGSNSAKNAIASDNFEKQYCPDERYIVAFNDYNGKLMDVSVEKGALSIPEKSESYNSATETVVWFELPSPGLKGTSEGVWNDLTLDDGKTKTSVNAVYPSSTYTLKISSPSDIKVMQNGAELTPVGGLYTVADSSEVTVISNSDEVLKWYDKNGNMLSSEKNYTYIPNADLELCHKAENTQDIFVFDAEDGVPLKTGYAMEDYLTQDFADGSFKVTRAVSLRSGDGFDYNFNISKEGNYDILVKILQQGQYNYYINMFLDNVGVSGNASNPGRYGISSKYSQDFHWCKLDTENLTAGNHKITVKWNKNMILDRVMIVKSDYAVNGNNSVAGVTYSESFEKEKCPDERYTVAMNDYLGKQLALSVEKGATAIPEVTESFNSGTNEVVYFNLPSPRVKEHYSGVWEELTLDDGVTKTSVNAVYAAKKYTLTIVGTSDIIVKQNGTALASVDGVYTVDAMAEVSITGNSSETMEWYDEDGNLLSSDKEYIYTPKGDTKLYHNPEFLKAGLESVLINGEPLEGFFYSNISYTVKLEKGIEYPVISATAKESASTVTITQPADNNGTGIIKVKNGEYELEYKIVFIKLDYTITPATIMDKKNGADSIIVLIHDDGSLKTATFMKDEFIAKGLKGSVAIPSDNIKTAEAVANWQALFDTGVLNLASHSKTHNYMGITDEAHTITWTGKSDMSTTEQRTYPAGNLTAEIKGSQDALREKFPGQRVLAFCHVGAGYAVVDGDILHTSDEAYEIMEKCYVGGRGNFGTDGGSKKYIWPRSEGQWYKIGYMSDAYDKFDANGNITSRAEEHIDGAIAAKGFYLYFWHLINDDVLTNSTQTKKQNASEFFSYLSEKVEDNTVWNPFFEEALQYGREYQDVLANGIYEIRTYNEDKLAVYLSDTLSDEMFDYPLTVKVEVNPTWIGVKQIHNGEETLLTPFEEDGKSYVYAQVVPDTGEAVLTNSANKKFETWTNPAPVNPPKGIHPRVLFKEEDVPSIRANMMKGENIYAYNSLMEYVNKEITVPENQIAYDENIVDAIEGKAFYYAIYKDDPENSEAAIKAGKEALSGIEIMKMMNVVTDKVGITSRYAGRVMNVIAHVYDWCYDLLSREHKATVPNLFREYGQYMENWVKPSEGDVRDGSISIMSPVAGHVSESLLLRDMLSFAVAVYDERPDIWNSAGGIYYDKYVPARAFWSPSNYTHQGGDYGNYRQQFDDYAIMLMLGMGAEAPYDIKNVADTGYKYIYMRRPDGTMFQDGDDATKISPISYYTSYADSLILKYAMSKKLGSYDPYIKGEMLRSCLSYEGDKISFNSRLNPLFMLIYNDPDDAPKSRYDLPSARYFGSPSGIMMTRTGWEDGENTSAAAAFMKIGEYSFNEHQHLDAGSFQLYYKGLLAADSGNYELYGAEEHAFYTRKTVAHNSMLVFKPDEYVRLEGTPGIDYKWSPSANNFLLRMGDTNDGGQVAKNMYAIASDVEMVKERLKNTEILAKEIDPEHTQRPEYTYLKGDLTGAYWNGVDENTRKVSNYDRSFMFLDLDDKEVPAALIVFDEMTAVDKTYKKTWLLHGTEEPEVNGNKTVFENTAENNFGNYGGRLEVTTLLPEADNIRTDVVGGPEDGYGIVRRWAYNEEISDWEMTFEHNYENTYTDPKRETNGYRIEISPKTPSAKDCFLNVMLMTDAGKPTNINPVLKETANFYGVTLFDRAVYFATESENNTVFITEEEGSYKYTVCDMKPGKYIVSDSVGSSEVYVSEDGHILSFTATGSVSAEWQNDSYLAPVDAEYKTYDSINIRTGKNFISSGDTIKKDGKEDIYVNVEKFVEAVGLKLENNGNSYRVFDGNIKLATIFPSEEKLVTKRGYMKPDGGIIYENDSVYMKLSVLFTLFAGKGSYTPVPDTFYGNPAELFFDSQVYAQAFTKAETTYVNVHIANGFDAEIYCGVYKEDKLVTAKKLNEGTIEGAYRGEFDATETEGGEFRIFLWTDSNAPFSDSITLKSVESDDITVYGHTKTVLSPPSPKSIFLFSAGTMKSENDAFELVKTDSTKDSAAFGFQFDYYNGPKLNTDYIGHYSAVIKDISASCPAERMQLRIGGRATKNSNLFTGATTKVVYLPRKTGSEYEFDCIVDYKNLMAYVYIDGVLKNEVSLASWCEEGNADCAFLISTLQIYLTGSIGWSGGAMNVYFPTYTCYPAGDAPDIENLVKDNCIIYN